MCNLLILSISPWGMTGNMHDETSTAIRLDSIKNTLAYENANCLFHFAFIFYSIQIESSRSYFYTFSGPLAPGSTASRWGVAHDADWRATSDRVRSTWNKGVTAVSWNGFLVGNDSHVSLGWREWRYHSAMALHTQSTYKTKIKKKEIIWKRENWQC